MTDSAPAALAKPSLEHYVMRLRVAAEAVVRSHNGLGELDLIKALQGDPWHLIGPVNFNAPGELYPVHFILFHVLYQLRSDLIAEGETLDISPLGIHIRVAAGNATGSLNPGPPDQLAAFYLNLDNYNLADEIVETMLDNFWRGVRAPTSESVSEALETLHLDTLPEQFSIAKRQFRRLAMQHHPDRGGDTRRLQQLNAALAVLRQHFDARGFPT